VAVAGDPATIARLAPHRDWLAEELLATGFDIAEGATLDQPDRRESATLDGTTLELAVARA